VMGEASPVVSAYAPTVTPLPSDDFMNAIYGGRGAVAMSLIPKLGDVNRPSRHGTLPLYAAAIQGEEKVVRALLERGADANAESLGETEGTALCAAASAGHIAVVQALLDGGADPNFAERSNEFAATPLY